jgi:hypothetical protein
MTRTDEAMLNAAIVAAVAGRHPLRAVDPERLSALVSWGRPNPRKTLTVRRTGHEGRRLAPDPPDILARIRLRRLLGELEDAMPVAAALTVGAAFGVRQTSTADDLRRQGHHFDQRAIPALIDLGRAWLWERWG